MAMDVPLLKLIAINGPSIVILNSVVLIFGESVESWLSIDKNIWEVISGDPLRFGLVIKKLRKNTRTDGKANNQNASRGAKLCTENFSKKISENW